MIRAMVRLEGTDTHLLVIGLSRENTRRLMLGERILFDGHEMGIDHTKVLILAGETEAEIAIELEAMGVKRPS